LGAVHYLDPEQRAVRPEPDWATRDLREGEHLRHPVTDDLLGAFPFSGAIFVSAAPEAQREMDMLAARGVPIAVLPSTVDDPELADRWSPYDPARDLLRGRRRDRWAESEQWPERRPPRGDGVPYAFVVQRLILQWSRRRGDDLRSE
jgi:hypothetical protein